MLNTFGLLNRVVLKFRVAINHAPRTLSRIAINEGRRKRGRVYDKTLTLKSAINVIKIFQLEGPRVTEIFSLLCFKNKQRAAASVAVHNAPTHTHVAAEAHVGGTRRRARVQPEEGNSKRVLRLFL